MTLSTILEVAIGLVLIYYALGLIVNIILAIIKDFYDMRAEALEEMLKQLLETNEDKLFTKFKEYPLIQNLKPIIPKFVQKVNRNDTKAPDIPDTTFSLALLNVLSSSDLVFNGVREAINQFVAEQTDDTIKQMLNNILEFEDKDLIAGLRNAVKKIPDETTKQKLGGWITLLLGTPEEQLDLIRAGIQGLPKGETKNALLNLIDFGTAEVKEARARLETWYDGMMKNVSLLFTKNVRKWVIAVSLVVAFIVGADSIYIAQTLWKQPARRAAMAEAVPRFIEDFGPGELSSDEMAKLTAPEKLKVLQGRVDEVDKIIDSLGELDAPVTWLQSPMPADLAGRVSKIIGLIITGAATSLGSSFWYDILKRINPRSTTQSTIKRAGTQAS